VAHAVATLNSWSAEGVRLADVLGALEDLRRPDRLSATRTSVLTLVLVARDRRPVERAVSAVHELGARHPARCLVVLVQPDAGESGIDAEVRLLGGEAGGLAVWFENVELTVRGPAVGHLDSLIEPFTLPDLPVVAWFVDGLPDPDDSLLDAADVLLVDSRDFGDVACFSVLASLTRLRPVVDLSWVRLRPWRELLAGLFEGAVFRPFVAGVRSAEVTGKTGPRHLLAGWLADRLGLASPNLRLVDAEHASARLTAEHEGRIGTFSVARRPGERVVVAAASVEGGPAHETLVVLPEATPAWGLADALSRLGRDAVYEGALRTTLSF
jgi:glucose-6-phosphate dehydrogenase assembly protein OpcA